MHSKQQSTVKLTHLLLPLALLLSAATLTSCDKDEDPTLVGDWEIDDFEIAGQSIGATGELEFDDDGEFEGVIEVGDDRDRLEGEWELDGDELELEYEEDPRRFRGIIGLLAGADILEEEWEVEFDGLDEATLTMEVGADDTEIVMTLERD